LAHGGTWQVGRFIYEAEAFSGQQYFPNEVQRQRFYQPTDRSAEPAIAERLKRWDALRAKRARGQRGRGQ